MESTPQVQFIEIQLKKKRIGILSLPGRIVSLVLGIISFLISIPCFFTLILIPLAIGLWMFGSFLILGAFFNAQKVVCPHCNHKQLVTNKSLNIECKRCKQLTLINWVK